MSNSSKWTSLLLPSIFLSLSFSPLFISNLFSSTIKRPHLRFTNLTLVSRHGLPTSESQALASSMSYSDRDRKQIFWQAWYESIWSLERGDRRENADVGLLRIPLACSLTDISLAIMVTIISSLPDVPFFSPFYPFIFLFFAFYYIFHCYFYIIPQIRVNVVKGKMIQLRRNEQEIVLEDESVVPYDYLILTPGLQYMHMLNSQTPPSGVFHVNDGQDAQAMLDWITAHASAGSSAAVVWIHEECPYLSLTLWDDVWITWM